MHNCTHCFSTEFSFPISSSPSSGAPGARGPKTQYYSCINHSGRPPKYEAAKPKYEDPGNLELKFGPPGQNFHSQFLRLPRLEPLEPGGPKTQYSLRVNHSGRQPKYEAAKPKYKDTGNLESKFWPPGPNFHPQFVPLPRLGPRSQGSEQRQGLNSMERYPQPQHPTS